MGKIMNKVFLLELLRIEFYNKIGMVDHYYLMYCIIIIIMLE